MIPNTQRSVEWAAGEGDAQWDTGWGFLAGGELEDPSAVPAEEQRLGHDLLNFLSDFRTAQHEEVARAHEAATAKRPVSPGRRGLNPTLASPADEAQKVAEAYDPYAGSETQVSPEWWQASDGRWYPPELHPDVQVPPRPQEVASAGGDEAPVAASRPVEPYAKVKLLGAWPRLGMFHSAGTAAL